MFKIFITFCTTIAVTIVSEYLATHYTIPLSFLTENQAYTTSLTIYIALCIALIEVVKEYNKKANEKKSQLKALYSMEDRRFSEIADVPVNFNSDIAKIYLQINFNGFSSELVNKALVLTFPPQVRPEELDPYAKYTKIEYTSNKIVISFDQVFNLNKQERMNDTVIIGFVVTAHMEHIDSAIETTITEKSKKLIFEKNNAKILK